MAIASATRMPKSTLKLWQSQLMNRYAQNGVFIPTYLKPGRFTQFAFDNLDSIGQYWRRGYSKCFSAKITRSSLQFLQPFNAGESHLSLKDRQKSCSLLGVETEPVLPVCLAEPLNHSNTFWNLVHICPTLLLEDVHPIGNAST